MTRFVLALLLLAVGSISDAAARDRDAVVSHSGQFSVIGRPNHGRLDAFYLATPPGFVRLQPELLSLSAERIKRAFLNELNLPDAAAGKIQLHLLDQPPLPNEITIVSTRYADGWQYKVGIPARVNEVVLIQSIVQTLLLELANRGSSRSAELPRWLVEGFTQNLLWTVGPAYIIQNKAIAWEGVGRDPLFEPRKRLKSNRPLTVTEMSSPLPEYLVGEGLGLYESCSHLFVHELLAQRGGPALLTQFLQTLPSTWNWQTAFLSAYRAHFGAMLEVEKWWALALVDFTSHDNYQAWPRAEGLVRLRYALRTPLLVRTGPDSLPVRQDVELQTLIREPDFEGQKEALENKLNQMTLLSIHMPREAIPLVRQYREAIQDYLQKREKLGFTPDLKRDKAGSLQLLLRETTRRLAALDRQCEKLGNAPLPPASPDRIPRKRVLQVDGGVVAR